MRRALAEDVPARQSLADVLRQRGRAKENSRSLEGSSGHFLRLGRLAGGQVHGTAIGSLVWSV